MPISKRTLRNLLVGVLISVMKISPSMYKPPKPVTQNRPSKYMPPGACTWKTTPKYKVKQSKNGKFTSNYKASPIDFETQTSLLRQAPPKISPSKRVFEKYKSRGLFSEFYGNLCFINMYVAFCDRFQV